MASAPPAASSHSVLGAVALTAALLVAGAFLPKWLTFLVTMAAARGLVSLGIVLLMRGGVVSFGQGLVFAIGAYAAALAFRRLGFSDAVGLALAGGVAAAGVALPFAPLLSRYRGIFFAMLTLALSMVAYGVLVKTESLGGSDGFNMARPTVFGQTLADAHAGYVLYAVTIVIAALLALAARFYFDSTRGLVSLAVRENELRVEYLGGSVRRVMAINFLLAAFAGGVGGALTVMSLGHVDPNFSYWTTSGEFVFVAILAGWQSVPAVFVASAVLEVVRSFSSLYFPNTWQLSLGLFLLFVIRFLPRGIGSLWVGRALWRRGAVAPMSSATPVLHAAGIEKRFGALVAASAIDISIAAGERVSLIGSNGAGKTTFVNIITGYMKPDAGRVALGGRDITALHPRAIARLGVARSFQIPQLYPALSVIENMLVAIACGGERLSFWRAARRADAVRGADAILERFGLAGQRERRVAELPGGVRKLLDVAMALAGRPQLLLLDEPTSGVAAEEKFPLMDTIMTALGGEPMTVVFVEHDMEIVTRYADRVIAFASGRVIADAAPAVALANEDVRRHVTGAPGPSAAR